MLKRIITGAFIVAVTVGFFLLRQLVDYRLFYIYLAAISLVSTFEMLRACGEKINLPRKVTVLAAQALALVGFFFGGWGWALASLCVAAVVLMLIAVFSGEGDLSSLAVSFLCLIYPGAFHLMLFAMNSIGELSFIALLLTFAISPLCDTMAFFTGVALKGPKLCPAVSPNKTVSGAAGGLIGGVIGGILVYAIFGGEFTYHLNSSPYLWFALVGLVAGALTELGDLAESYIKRQTGIKDSGKIFPGHGGMLDRVDGMTLASAFIYAVTAIL